MDRSTQVWIAGWNMAGYLPEMEPYVTTDHESARRCLIDEIKSRADYLAEGDEDDAEDRAAAADALAEDVNLWTGEDSCLLEMSEHRDDSFWIQSSTIGDLLADGWDADELAEMLGEDIDEDAEVKA